MSNEELADAAEIHYGFLPHNYADDNVNIAVSIRPHHYVGGDYCNVIPLSNNKMVACMCDVAGHGISSALFAARINTFVAAHSHISHCPCELIKALNEFMCKRFMSARVLTTFYAAFFDFQTGQVFYVGAGHPPMLYYQNKTHNVTELASVTTPIGVGHPLPVECQVTELAFKPDDRFFLYTDGVNESRNMDKEQFGLARLSDFILSNRKLSVQEYNTALIKNLTEFNGDKFQDDLLLMSMHIN